VLDHQPENLTADLEYMGYRAGTVATQTQAEMGTDCLEESHSVWASRAVLDGCEGRGEGVSVVVDEIVDEVQGEKLGSHIL
jgi:broad-specificity NMP kinase